MIGLDPGKIGILNEGNAQVDPVLKKLPRRQKGHIRICVEELLDFRKAVENFEGSKWLMVTKMPLRIDLIKR